jgi:phage gp46-like protein
MAASSSAIQLADLALTWLEPQGAADLSMIDADLASERGLETAVLLSLFLDRRAQPDDQPPSGDPADRRGWWADQLAAIEGDRIGSRLWLLDRSVRSGETARRAEEYVREALAWMIEDRVVSAVAVEIDATGNDLVIGVTLQRPGRDAVSFRFAHVWDATA